MLYLKKFQNGKSQVEYSWVAIPLNPGFLRFSNLVNETWDDIDVGGECWRQNVLVTSLNVADRSNMLVTDLIHWKDHQHNGKSRQHNDSVTNILNRSPS